MIKYRTLEYAVIYLTTDQATFPNNISCPRSCICIKHQSFAPFFSPQIDSVISIPKAVVTSNQKELSFLIDERHARQDRPPTRRRHTAAEIPNKFIRLPSSYRPPHHSSSPPSADLGNRFPPAFPQVPKLHPFETCRTTGGKRCHTRVRDK